MTVTERLVEEPLRPALPRFRGTIGLAARQFVRNRAAVAGLICLTLICLLAIFAPLV